ncbi:uncharacterized protein LOC6543140 [Drosophila erecta]|uniref:Uncharacterized protein, isoform A n=1 Tax=Drosophila erecta TaxID=7220 RepID=B3N8Q4_DROER|nr:uncharacterized protein LOC6543140 [Drosophila erecta]EDV59531.1 uncharacterized protein Dere_GG23352, isoform A [Drosophila erecta]KQS70877.1 uncharacterized protein Dere_GG23352, isoform B [Drosophila erecta]
MSMWRSIGTKTQNRVIPSFASVVSQRAFAEDHNPSPKCSNQSGKGCGNFTACGDPRFAKKAAPKKGDGFQFHHLIKAPPECCIDPCAERFPPYDQCYYKISDKAARKYQVTWVECPPIQIKPKKICCYEAGARPPIPRRKRKEFVPKCQENVECPSEEGDCPRIKMPGCRPVDNVSCHVVRRKTDCVKVKAPYPSFSECAHPPLRKPRAIECNCLDVPSSCDLIRELNRLEGSPRKPNCGGSRG